MSLSGAIALSVLLGAVLAINAYTVARPRQMALFGIRWRIRDGHRAEPSQDAVVITWLGSVVGVLVVGVLLAIIWHAYWVQEHAIQEAHRWGVAGPAEVVQVTPNPIPPGSDLTSAPAPLLGYARVSSQTIEVGYRGDGIGCSLVALDVRETTRTVTVTARVTAGVPQPGLIPLICAQADQVSVATINLRSPLGDRTVIDGSDGRPARRRA